MSKVLQLTHCGALKCYDVTISYIDWYVELCGIAGSCRLLINNGFIFELPSNNQNSTRYTYFRTIAGKKKKSRKRIKVMVVRKLKKRLASYDTLEYEILIQAYLRTLHFKRLLCGLVCLYWTFYLFIQFLKFQLSLAALGLPCCS